MLIMIKNLAIISFLSVILTGCNVFGPSPEEQIYEHLEEAVTLESNFEEQQTPLVELEKQEQEIYEEILQLGMSEFEKIQTLSDQALVLTEEREQRIEQERESILASQDEFVKIEPLLGEIENQAIQDKAKELQTTMEERYASYETLYENYKAAIEFDKGLYTLFKKQDLTLEELETHINDVNKSYEEVIAANNKFNQQTEAYNERKKEFYEMAELDIVFE